VDSIVKQLQTLTPLQKSFAVDEVEGQLKQLFIDLFDVHFQPDFHDANVLGMAHLGSLDLVRKIINLDGLVLLRDGREDYTTRRLYRAWRAGHLQGRGLHFLRAYLQLLFPNQCEVYQFWHENYEGRTYPEWLHKLTPQYSMHTVRLGEEGFYLDVDDPWYLNTHYYHLDEDMAPDAYSTFELFLTSRIGIEFGDDVERRTVRELSRILTSCMPARFVPSYQFWRNNVLSEPDDFDRWNLGERYLEPRILVNVTDWLPPE
jgi:hypothetical protein